MADVVVAVVYGVDGAAVVTPAFRAHPIDELGAEAELHVVDELGDGGERAGSVVPVAVVDGVDEGLGLVPDDVGEAGGVLVGGHALVSS